MNCDVCVIGAGPAAAASAIAARQAGAAVLLAGTLRSPRTGTLELLSTTAANTLLELGLYDLVRTTAHPCAGSVSRWFADEFIEHSCLLEPRGGGWIVDRAALDPLLLIEVAARGVQVLPERAVAVEPDAGTRSVQVRTRREKLSAATVIVAVGRGAGVVRRTTSRTLRHRMVALTVTLKPEAIPGLGHRLLVDRAPNGWWYALADTRATSIGYCVDADTLTTMGGTAAAWHEGCRAASDWLPRTAIGRAPRVRPATIGSTWPVAQHSVHLVGDAAFALDPLSGCGLALALESATRWADEDYVDWSRETDEIRQHEERQIYRAAAGGFDGPFWTRRRR